jgi:hypothetical protein
LLLSACSTVVVQKNQRGAAHRDKPKNGTASNRDNVSESGLILAAGILDALKPD